jgi:hypothetical protein
MAGTLGTVPRRSLLALVLLVVAVAACANGGPVSETSSGPGAPGTAGAAGGVATGAPAGSASPVTTDRPTPTDQPVPSHSAAPTDRPAKTGQPGGTPAASTGAGVADACTGSGDNRAFLVRVAGAVDWTVLCAVLPARWFMSAGSYRLANGGKLLLGYKGPGGATLALSEGAFCTGSDAADGCVSRGTEAGDAALGPLDGTLVRLADGGFTIVVDRGSNPSWLLETQGLDEATTVSLARAVVRVGE